MTDPESPIVYIVDDDRSVREALEDLLSSVALGSRSFASVQEFAGAARAEVPSCLVLDVRMPGQSGMEFLAHMAERGIVLPTVMITGHGDIAMGVRAMKDGAIEFLTKPFRDQDLLDAINRGIEIDRLRRAAAAETRRVRELWEALSPGEREVARLVVRGLLNKQVAAELGLSEITVKVRRGHMMRKMEARTLPDLVRAFDRIHG
ncbi:MULTISPECIES: response regulator [unclassified Sphingomonas]|jgi:FixJ family two-component response regulator|nr:MULTISPECIES: response regulator [unclassified Sphingomonas]